MLLCRMEKCHGLSLFFSQFYRISLFDRTTRCYRTFSFYFHFFLMLIRKYKIQYLPAESSYKRTVFLNEECNNMYFILSTFAMVRAYTLLLKAKPLIFNFSLKRLASFLI